LRGPRVERGVKPKRCPGRRVAFTCVGDLHSGESSVSRSRRLT
jgi:hypothetical protein